MLNYLRYPGRGFSIGRNDRDRFYFSVHRRMRGCRFEVEWHNYPEHTQTRYFSFGVASPKKYAWWAFSAGLWIPEYFMPVLTRIPAYVWRKY